MSRPVSKRSRDPFEGLQLPMGAWKALEDANITSLQQLKAMAPFIEQLPSIEPDIARAINDSLDRLAVKRTVRVRFVCPKRSHRQN